MAARAILETTINAELIRVFGDKAKFSALVTGFTDLVPAPPQIINFQRSGSSARQYPGDTTPISRGGADVETLKPTPNYRSTLPGRPFWLETTTGTGPDRVTTVRQFTFTGTFRNLRAAVAAGATQAMILRSPNGKPKDIADPTP